MIAVNRTNVSSRLYAALRLCLVGLAVLVGCLFVCAAILSSVIDRKITLWSADSVTYSGETALVWRRFEASIEGHRIEFRADAQCAEFGQNRPTLATARSNLVWRLGSAAHLLGATLQPPTVDVFGIRYESGSHREAFRIDTSKRVSAHALVIDFLAGLILLVSFYFVRRRISKNRRGFEIVRPERT